MTIMGFSESNVSSASIRRSVVPVRSVVPARLVVATRLRAAAKGLVRQAVLFRLQIARQALFFLAQTSDLRSHFRAFAVGNAQFELRSRAHRPGCRLELGIGKAQVG